MHYIKNKKEMRLKLTYIAICTVTLFVIFVSMTRTATAIQISSKRIALTPDHPQYELGIINNSGQEQTYTLQWAYYEMQESGRLIKLEDRNTNQNIKWADDIITLEHTHVTLSPNEERNITLSLNEIKPELSGEYRAHLWIYTHPEFPTDYRQHTSTQLSFLTGLVIPVFARFPKTTQTTNKIDNISLSNPEGDDPSQKTLNLKFSIYQTGDYSTYGNIDISCTRQKKDTLIKTMYGFAIYPEIKKRDFKTTLNLTSAQYKNCHDIKLQYIDSKSHSTFATASTSLRVLK